jgi:hypothetical protein
MAREPPSIGTTPQSFHPSSDTSKDGGHAVFHVRSTHSRLARITNWSIIPKSNPDLTSSDCLQIHVAGHPRAHLGLIDFALGC